MRSRRVGLICASVLALILAVPSALAGQANAVQTTSSGVTFQLQDAQVSINLQGAGVLHVQTHVAGAAELSTLVIDPHARPRPAIHATVHADAGEVSLRSERLLAVWHKASGLLDVSDVQGHQLLQLDLARLLHGTVQVTHAKDDTLYGIGSYSTHQSTAAGIVRRGKQVAEAGTQGHAGAPFVWSTAGYGVLVNSDGARFDLQPGSITVDQLSGHAVDLYLLVGKPMQLFDALADLSGHAPMFPKWSMGFLNSQWGIDQSQLISIVDTYRRKHIPIDGFILDFDWKAWGKDDYGEFRWNREKFPGGPDGTLKAMLDARGIHLGGIMKPRIHLGTVEGRYATAHHLWRPGEKASEDYFSHKPVKNLDFDKPATRAWFFNDTLKHSFDTGMVAWWNDEADTTDSNTQFLNMQRSLYEGQRKYSKRRVWSLNRNFWLGSQRYAYGLWSGDIDTGFESMAKQRARMLSAINVGEMQWSMDIGGFNGHPTPENYARWVEFGAFAPIFRVHGTYHEKRQPWVYGPVAEKAATRAIRLRYALLPYIYSVTHAASVDGVGLVRPLVFGWPHDAKLRNTVDAWMFGPWLLVSPVVKQGQTEKDVYLPAGSWIDWFSGKRYAGGQTVSLALDNMTWSDIPLFIRAGAIIPTQPVLDFVGQRPISQVSLDVFPSAQWTHFDYYDDDGDTYAYQQGVYFKQRLSVRQVDGKVQFRTAKPQGSYQPALRYYVVKVHGPAAASVLADGQALAQVDDLDQTTGQAWAIGHDRYGPVTLVRIRAGVARALVLMPSD